MTLIEIRIFADMCKDLEMRSSWMRVDPKSSEDCLYRRQKNRDRATEKTMLAEIGVICLQATEGQ